MNHYDEQKFNARYFEKNGGDLEHPPYIDTVKRISPFGLADYRRVFVCVDWFPEWTAWNQQAEAAIGATKKDTMYYTGEFTTRPNGPSLITEPHYIFEKDFMRLWVNVGCPHAEAFEDVKKEAAERVLKCQQMEKRFGPLAQIQPGYPKIEFCQYAPSENIVKKGSIEYMAITNRI